MVKSKRGHDPDEDDEWLEDDEDNDLDQEEESLMEEFTNADQDFEDELTLEELMAAIDSLEDLEHEDGTLGRNTVMKVHFVCC